MAVPTNKSELIVAIQKNYDKLREELSTIPLEKTKDATLEGHAKNTIMSINNLLAYLVGWGELVLKWIEQKDQNMPVDFPETGYKWNELGKLAQKFYKDYEQDDFLQLTSKLDETVQKNLHIIQSRSNHQLYEVPWYEKWTLGRMIQFNTSSPYTNARGKIRKWKKENNLK